ncbi:hypothetical protein RHMOL_Rhmol13G0122300 [Rhododendron molle]|uniref:Uncharacterized protein n=1 Tax=Rhododendron molle TaxID=49168 RepID=A0ACC0L5R4_RHOML|nr:hypothetical protein RHMOL_Rhmol13G0122300 [Rhododendron molle]
MITETKRKLGLGLGDSFEEANQEVQPGDAGDDRELNFNLYHEYEDDDMPEHLKIIDSHKKATQEALLATEADYDRDFELCIEEEEANWPNDIFLFEIPVPRLNLRHFLIEFDRRQESEHYEPEFRMENFLFQLEMDQNARILLPRVDVMMHLPEVRIPPRTQTKGENQVYRQSTQNLVHGHPTE